MFSAYAACEYLEVRNPELNSAICVLAQNLYRDNLTKRQRKKVNNKMDNGDLLQSGIDLAIPVLWMTYLFATK